MIPKARFTEIISKLVDDQISDDEVAELQSLLGNHPELSTELVDHLLLDTLLSESLGQEPLIALVDTISEPPTHPQPNTKTPHETPTTFLREQIAPWGWLAAAAVLVIGLSYFFLQGDRLALAGASQYVQAAIHTHSAAIERIYVVEVKRGPTNDKLVELPRDVRVATQGDRFWAQMRGQREWVLGRNEDGAVWMALGPKQAVIVNAEEMGMPLRYIGDLYTLNLETLLKSFLKYYQLELSDGPADSTVIVATPRRAWSNRPLKRATIEVDRETKAIRKLILEREVDGSNSISTFTLVDSRLADESLYQPEGHLSDPYEIFGTETRLNSRRERVMNWFGSRADRWLQIQDSKPQ